jgi:hypothetical protein
MLRVGCGPKIGALSSLVRSIAGRSLRGDVVKAGFFNGTVVKDKSFSLHATAWKGEMR